MAASVAGVFCFDAESASMQGIGETTDVGLIADRCEVLDAAICGEIRLCEAPFSQDFRRYTAELRRTCT